MSDILANVYQIGRVLIKAKGFILTMHTAEKDQILWVL